MRKPPKTFFSGAALLCAALILLCQCAKEDPLARVRVLDNPLLKVSSRPKLLAERLHNPMSPRLLGGRLVVAESGAGNLSAVEGGKLKPLISGFVKDNFAGYDISAQGVTVDPETGWWIVAAAEGPGRILLFEPSSFPAEAKRGRDVPLEGATEDNPFGTVLAAGGRILVASGGTRSAYQGEFTRVGNPNPLKPAFEVSTGLIGIALDPKSGDVFGAVFGNAPGTGTVVRWDATKQPVTLRTVAKGLTNPVDVAFTPDGMLLTLEFGGFGAKGEGRISVVAADGAVSPLVTGLNNPSGFFVAPDNTLYVTEYGPTMNAPEGTLLSMGLAPAGKY